VTYNRAFFMFYTFLSMFSESLILGPEPDGVGGIMSTFSSAETGGLVARGEGTAGNPNGVVGPRLNPRLGKFGVAAGVVAVPEVPVVALGVLNSAHFGHFRLVFMWPI